MILLNRHQRKHWKEIAGQTTGQELCSMLGKRIFMKLRHLTAKSITESESRR